MTFALPKAAAGTMVAGAMLGTAAMVGAGVGLATVMGISFLCRRCGYRGRVERSKFDGHCTKCGEGIYRRDVKRVRIQISIETERGSVQIGESGAATTAEEIAILNQIPIGIKRDADPVQILKVRLAKGDITPEQYKSTLEILRVR